MHLGWYAAIPYVAAAIAMYAAARRSDKVGERRYHSALPALAAAALLVMTPYASGNLVVTLTLLTLATACMWMAYTVFWAIPSETISGPAAAGGIALINTIGLSGGFWGPAMIGWVKSATGSTNGGLVVMACMAALSCVLILSNRRTVAAAEARTA
jgi:nitrate/nitrite transporter NarK